MHGSRRPRPASLRLVVAHANDPLREWSREAVREGRDFLVRRGHLLSDPSLATWVIEQCAELIAEVTQGEIGWDALPLEEVWRRLDNLQRFFPQPRLVVAHYETLSVFVPWLRGRGLLTPTRCEEMLAQLERVGAATLRRAREQLTMRHLGTTPGRWES